MRKIIVSVLFLSGAFAQASDSFKVTITNGSNMPIAPGVLYVSPDAKGTAYVGSAPTQGFVHMCQMGNPAERTMELKADTSVLNVAKMRLQQSQAQVKTMLNFGDRPARALTDIPARSR